MKKVRRPAIGDVLIYYGKWLWKIWRISGDIITIKSLKTGEYANTNLDYGGWMIVKGEADDGE